VNTTPSSSITGPTEGCRADTLLFIGNATSVDNNINFRKWVVSNGVVRNTPNLTIIFSTPGTYNIDFIVGTTNGCYDTSRRTITVFSVPVLNFNVASQYVINSNGIQLSASPIGGTFSGPGVVSNTFFTALAGAGVWNLTYTYTDVATGCVVTLTKTVTVIESPSIRTNPLSQTVCAGSSFTLNVNARGTNISYQWYKNGTAISGQTSAVLTFNPVALLNSGSYSVRVANTVDTVYSNNAILTVNVSTSSTVTCVFIQMSFSLIKIWVAGPEEGRDDCPSQREGNHGAEENRQEREEKEFQGESVRTSIPSILLGSS
jgi:hypothetical protein